MRLALVHHRPGRREGYHHIEDLAETISRLTGWEVEGVEIGSPAHNSYDAAVILLLSRGGHYLEALESVRAEKVVGPIPPWLPALALTGVEGLKGSRRVALVYWGAKRNREEHDRGYAEIASNASSLLNCKVDPVPHDTVKEDPRAFKDKYDSIVVLTLLPSRLPRLLSKYVGGEIVEAQLLPSSKGMLTAWIISVASTLTGST